jgi:NAD(P)-dependent dehydrogenase (short-subunit alcohol dehydrogenase family)
MRVLAVVSGPVRTDRIAALLRSRAEAEFGDPGRRRESTSKWPMVGAARAEACADPMVFAASARASYISGAVLTIDGGIGARA